MTEYSMGMDSWGNSNRKQGSLDPRVRSPLEYFKMGDVAGEAYNGTNLDSFANGVNFQAPQQES